MPSSLLCVDCCDPSLIAQWISFTSLTSTSPLSHRDSTSRYLATNEPVIFTHCTDDLPVRRRWTLSLTPPSPPSLPLPSLPPHLFPSFHAFPALLANVHDFVASSLPPPTLHPKPPPFLHPRPHVHAPRVNCALPTPHLHNLRLHLLHSIALPHPPHLLYLRDWRLPLDIVLRRARGLLKELGVRFTGDINEG